MQAPDHIADLIFKYLRNELSGAEQKQLSHWRQASERNEELFQRLTDPEQVREQMQGLYSKKKSWDKIVAQVPELKNDEIVQKQRRWPFSIAATVLTLLGVSAIIVAISFNYLNQKNKATSAALSAHTDTTKNDLPPGTNKAILTLSNGEKIILDTTKVQHDVAELGNNIRELDHGSLLYEASALNTTGNDVFNTLETPRGGQFQLSLPDGTRVWLNAASSVRYPIAFTGNERKVEISGEVYFEVSKNEKQPFIVSTGDAKVEVLGTHFNVNAYSDESSIKITLLEGSIKTVAGSNSRIIKPGEQASIEKSSIRIIDNIDVNDAVSWKNGRTFFKDADIPSIMRMVSRWYDVDVDYKGNIPVRSITGGISRNANFSDLLKVLELNDIHFRREGKTITITP